MLSDFIMDLLTAAPDDKKAIDRAYRNLEKLGVDKMTADAIAAEFKKENGTREGQQR